MDTNNNQSATTETVARVAPGAQQSKGYIELHVVAVDADFQRPLDKPESHFPNLTGYLCPDGQQGMWSGKSAMPAIGSRVLTNEWGAAEVVGYFREGGWMGVLVNPDTAPKWWTKRNRGPKPDKVHQFGLDIGGAS